MTEASSLGTMDSAPGPQGQNRWRRLDALGEDRRGRPNSDVPRAFADHIDESKWVSFTTTLHDPTLLSDRPGLHRQRARGGRSDHFPESSWLASIVFHTNRTSSASPTTVDVFWGYGLFVDKPGDFVKKPMSACTGREIMTEVLGICRSTRTRRKILESPSAFPA